MDLDDIVMAAADKKHFDVVMGLGMGGLVALGGLVLLVLSNEVLVGGGLMAAGAYMEFTGSK